MTLYDFQLAERMNRDFKITAKEFRLFPFLRRESWASFFIFMGAYLVIMQLTSIIVTLNHY